MFSEDEDFNPKLISNLASLFSSTKNSNIGEHSFDINKTEGPDIVSELSPASKSLTLTHQPSVAPAASLQLIIVKLVKAFLFKDKNYENHGKLAIALLGNSILKHYQIILYRDKHNHVAKTFINSSFWFGVQGNNYASFYDRNSSIWTVMYDFSSDFIDFCTEVALAKWVCLVPQNEILMQDFVCFNTGKSIKQFDNVKINYVASILDDHFRPLKDSIVQGIRNVYLSLSDEWEKFVIDTVENSRRLLIIPQTLVGPWEQIIGKSCNFGLLLDFTVEFATDNQETSDGMKPPNVELVLPKLPSNDDGLNSDKIVKKKSDTSSELSTENLLPKKSELISRMGCLGKPVLPLNNATSSAGDNDDTEEDTSSTHSGPSNRSVSKMKPLKSKQKTTPPSFQQPQHQLPVMPNYSHQQHLSTAVVGYSGSIFTPVTLPPVDLQLPILFSELRTHNSELRMGLNSVTDKVDKVLDKIQMGPTNKLFEQLEKTNKEIMDQFSSLNQLNDEVHKTLLTKNEDPKRKSRIIVEEFNNENIDKLKKENDELLHSSIETKNLIKKIQEKISKCKCENKELEDLLSEENKASAELRKELMRIALELNRKSSDKITDVLELPLQNLMTKVESLQKSLDVLNVTINKMNSKPSLTGDEEIDASVIRENMNNLYKLLKSQFKPDILYSSADVHDTFSNILKSYC